MTIKDLREILIHYEGKEYDDWEISLWDYNNQRNIIWHGGSYASSKETKSITFPVEVEPVDGVTVSERVKKIIDKDKSQHIKEIKQILLDCKAKLAEISNDFDDKCKEIIEKLK